MEQNDQLAVRVEDKWAMVRTQLGVAAVQHVQYTWAGEQVCI
jgi:hypothetical protein